MIFSLLKQMQNEADGTVIQRSRSATLPRWSLSTRRQCSVCFIDCRRQPSDEREGAVIAAEKVREKLVKGDELAYRTRSFAAPQREVGCC